MNILKLQIITSNQRRYGNVKRIVRNAAHRRSSRLMHRLPFRKNQSQRRRTSHPLRCDWANEKSITERSSSLCIFKDDCSGWRVVNFLKNISEEANYFRPLVARLKAETGNGQNSKIRQRWWIWRRKIQELAHVTKNSSWDHCPLFSWTKWCRRKGNRLKASETTWRLVPQSC